MVADALGFSQVIFREFLPRTSTDKSGGEVECVVADTDALHSLQAPPLPACTR